MSDTVERLALRTRWVYWWSTWNLPRLIRHLCKTGNNYNKVHFYNCPSLQRSYIFPKARRS